MPPPSICACRYSRGHTHVVPEEKVRGILKTSGSLPQDVVTRCLNPVIRGWGNDYRHVVSKEVFSNIDHALWCMAWNWAKRRHPRKGRKWVKDD